MCVVDLCAMRSIRNGMPNSPVDAHYVFNGGPGNSLYYGGFLLIRIHIWPISGSEN